MPQNTLIQVLRDKLLIALPYKALMGQYSERLFKAYNGAVTISDPLLQEKLTADEYRELAAKYPYLAPAEALPPEPPLLTVEQAEVLGEERHEVTTDIEPETIAPKKRGRKAKTNTEQA